MIVVAILLIIPAMAMIGSIGDLAMKADRRDLRQMAYVGTICLVMAMFALLSRV